MALCDNAGADARNDQPNRPTLDVLSKDLQCCVLRCLWRPVYTFQCFCMSQDFPPPSPTLPFPLMTIPVLLVVVTDLPRTAGPTTSGPGRPPRRPVNASKEVTNWWELPVPTQSLRCTACEECWRGATEIRQQHSPWSSSPVTRSTPARPLCYLRSTSLLGRHFLRLSGPCQSGGVIAYLITNRTTEKRLAQQVDQWEFTRNAYLPSIHPHLASIAFAEADRRAAPRRCGLS